MKKFNYGGNYLFIVNNKDTRMLSIDIVLVSLLLTLNRSLLLTCVSVVDFQQVNFGLEPIELHIFLKKVKRRAIESYVETYCQKTRIPIIWKPIS